ncbi:hypothetical protein SZN_36409 [Streptomyces zinciresistens K42]|uniref:Uncharacterized protein n=2 Tax=Streptomyces TaxID=1883 RepID=G2GP26_9ACTN|nr:hypothetical protein SZN_36409 [Streptomyces zinciresistens K42]
MQHSMTRTTAQPRAGIIDDIEREDDSKGYEPEDAARVDVALVLVLNLAPVQSGWTVAA